MNNPNTYTTMKKYILTVCTVLLALLCTVACGDGNQPSDKSAGSETGKEASAVTKTASKAKAKKAKKSRKSRKSRKSVFIPSSAGAPYEVLIVAGEDSFHSGAVDTLYNIMTDDVPGIAQSEPLFKVSRINQSNFSKTLRLTRNVIIVKIDPSTYSKCKIKFSRDVYASPQIVMTIQAPSAFKFINFVKDNSEVITELFNRSELNRQCEILKEDHQPVVEEQVQNIFGCDIYVPAELTKIKKARNFVWARCEKFVKRVEQHTNIVIYSYPYTDVNTFTKEYFVHKRDSVMKLHIPGPSEGKYMMTTMPFVISSDEVVHGKYAQVVRGLWNVKDYDMGGPFVSVSRVDEKNQRVVVAEAFIYYPNKEKRDPLRRLEAALYTLRLPDELDLEKFSFDLDEIVITPED